MLNQSSTVPVYDVQGKVLSNISLPAIFSTTIHPDVIKRAVLAVQTARLQPKGRDPRAGKRTTAVSRGVGLGIARVPRVKGSGYSRAGEAALIHSAKGGRLAHPPKVQKNIVKRINRKEKLLAVRSAIAATASPSLLVKRGHILQDNAVVPLVVEDSLEELKTTSAVVKLLDALNLKDELEKITSNIKIRAGKGKMRGRRFKTRIGPLFIINQDKGIRKAAANIPGVDVIPVRRLNAELLAPGTQPGRLTIWSQSALNALNTERLFV